MVSAKQLLAYAILLTISHSINAEYDVDSYCTLVKNNVRLGSVENCQTYYICENGKGIKGTCPASQSFDKNLQLCRPSSDVNCYFGNEKPCQTKVEGFVPMVGTCNGYIWCKNYAESGRGYCPENLIFYQGECMHGGDCQDHINEGTSGMNSVCDIMPDNLFFGSTKDCKIWQKCIKGKLSSGNCPTNYVFDVAIESCNHKRGNMCSRVTGQDIQPDPTPTRKCSAMEKGNIEPDITICSAYYTCDGSKWVRQNCGLGLFFSTLTNKCELRQYATPSPNCNRCEFSKKLFVNAVDPFCSDYLLCSDGVKKSVGSCGADKYFDESSQACLEDTKGRSTYSLKNGACFNCNATCNALSGSKCLPKSGCKCGMLKSECVDCGTENCCDSVCSALDGANCKQVGECNCDLDSNNKCVNCETGNCVPAINCDSVCNAQDGANCKQEGECNCAVDSNNKCVNCETGNCVPAINCDSVCNAQGSASCKQEGECNCGLDQTNTNCVNCDNNNCATAPVTDPCDEKCSNIATIDTCATAITDCTCGVNEGKCTNCASPNTCNSCICAGSTCTTDMTNCECYEDDQQQCIYCSAGIVEASNPKQCKSP